MSVDIPTSTHRVEGITTDQRTYPAPVRHGATGQFVIDDHDRDGTRLDDQFEHRNIPNGSLYQHARAAWYRAVEDDRTIDVERDSRTTTYAVLSTDYDPRWVDTDERYAVTMTSSRWMAGRGDGDDYSPFWKYDVTLRPLDDDGEPVFDRSPVHSYNLKLHPQIAGLQYRGGEPYECRWGEGTLAWVSTTWIEHPTEYLHRTADVVNHLWNYYLTDDDLVDDSKGYWKAEAHHRFVDDRVDDAVHTIRQSADLIPHHGGSVNNDGEADGGKWLEVKLTTDDWQLLGFPDLDVDVLLKVYYGDSKSAPYPLNQPKIEAALVGNHDEMLRWDTWETVHELLRDLVCSHLIWANITAADLVADDISDGFDNEPVVVEHPEGRRTWLRSHYQDLVPEIYREAQRERTTLTYDILAILAQRGVATYDELMAETGAAYRTVREHVRRLEQDVGGDGPGLVQRVQSVQTHIVWADEMLDLAQDAIAKIRPDDTPEDRAERAEERREERRERERRAEQRDQDDSDSGDDRASWKRFDRLALTVDQLGRALEQDYIEHQHVKLRVDQYDWVGAPG